MAQQLTVLSTPPEEFNLQHPHGSSQSSLMGFDTLFDLMTSVMLAYKQIKHPHT